MDPKSIIAAASLDTVDGTGRTLAVEASSSGAGGGDVALGSGAFGKVGTYRYHGATVAVKELKAGADAESIGALLLLFLVSRLRVYVLHPPPRCSCDHSPLHVWFVCHCCAMLRGRRWRCVGACSLPLDLCADRDH